MDKQKITDLSGQPPDTPITLTALEIVLWGQEMQFIGDCGGTAFRLILHDCREIRWQLYTHMRADGRPAFPPATVVSLALGKDQHRSALRMLTDYFGLVVTYGRVQMERV